MQDASDLPAEHFDSTIGLEVLDASAERVVARIPVSAGLLQPFGVVHGGVYCSIAESLASIGTWLGVRDDGKIALGLSNQTSFLRPARDGDLSGEAVVVHAGRTTWVWDVSIRDVDGRLLAVSRMTIAVREP